MSDDDFRFEFVGARDSPPDPPSYFDFGDNPARSEATDEVILFSGGLDSLAGAVDRLCHGNSRLLLVSHQSSTKIANRQRELAQELGRRFPKRVLHIPFEMRLEGIEAVERTQRSRSFLFAALAAVIARTGGVDRFSLFENGIVSFNLPISTQVVGTAATRTTHPRVVRGVADFLSTLLDDDIGVDNPFLWKTKADVAASLSGHGHADLAPRTVSCSRVYWMTRLRTHCGRCSQCLDRRFGALAAGLGEDDPAEMYEIDLLVGAREHEFDRTMAESFVRHALELQDLTERSLMDRFGGEVARAASCVPGMSPSDVVRAMLDLHQRHGAAVRSVLERGYQDYAGDLAGQTLPQTCILRLVAGPNDVVTPILAPPPTENFDLDDDRDFARSSQIRIALDTVNNRVLIQGAPPIEGATSFALFQALVDAYDKDRNQKLAPENHTFRNAQTLGKRLGTTETSLRRCIRRVRRQIADAFERVAGLPLSTNAVIENRRWSGYRLNPAVLIIAPDEVSASPRRHDSSQAASRLGNRVPIKAAT